MPKQAWIGPEDRIGKHVDDFLTHGGTVSSGDLLSITNIEVFRLSPRLVLVKVSTDASVVGWGEATLEGRAETVAATVLELCDPLIGTDPMPVERHWHILAKGGFYRGGPVLGSAVAGLDQALWDIRGKVLVAPVHVLLGGPVRDSIRVYAHANVDDVAELCERAAALVAIGYTALKTAPPAILGFIDTPAATHALVDRWTTLREAVGPGVDLAMDFHGRVSGPMARRLLPLLEPILPLFVEEPLPPEYSAELARVVDSTSIPIATGERLYSRWDVRPVIDSGIAILQPDVSHAHGISETMRIASLAELHHVGLAPHCAAGPVAFAASLQVDFAAQNAFIQESPVVLHDPAGSPSLQLLRAPDVFTFSGGVVQRLTGPGLGVDIDEDAVRAYAATPDGGSSPVWIASDGAFTEW